MRLPEELKVPWKARDALVLFALAWIGLPILLLIAARVVNPDFFNRLIDGNLEASFSFTVADLLASLAMVKLYLNRYHAGWRALGLRRPKILKSLFYLLLAIVLFWLLVSGLYALITHFFPAFNADQPQVNEFTNPSTPHARNLSLVALVLFPPLIEEIVFRGFIFPAIAQKWGVLGGAIVTSVLFGIAHWQLNVSVYTLALSLLLCLMYVRLRSIVPGIFLHMLNNYLAFAAIMHQ